jgi:peptide/nickel transport system substrate-binding protein
LTYIHEGNAVQYLKILCIVGMTSCLDLLPALAQDRRETLVAVTEVGSNSMDIHGIGANRPSYGLSWNVYDHLMTYGKKTFPN